MKCSDIVPHADTTTASMLQCIVPIRQCTEKSPQPVSTAANTGNIMAKKIVRGIKVQVTVTKTMWVYEDEFYEDAEGVPMDFNEHNAIMFTKGQMIQEMQNNPNRGSAKILEYGEFENV